MDESLCEAIKNKCSPDKIDALLAAGADVNERDAEKGGSPLMLAIKCEPGEVCERIADKLLAGGADVNAADEDGWTPLMFITWNPGGLPGEVCGRIADKLLAGGADVNAADEDGWTPLMFITWNRGGLPGEVCERIADKLLAGGADVNAANKHGVTPLMFITWNPGGLPGEVCGRIADKLLAGGADVNAASKDGRTSLQPAMENGLSLGVLRSLLRCGADPSNERAFSKVDDYLKKRPDTQRWQLLLVLQKFASATSDQTLYTKVQYGRDENRPKGELKRSLFPAIRFPFTFCFHLISGLITAKRKGQRVNI